MTNVELCVQSDVTTTGVITVRKNMKFRESRGNNQLLALQPAKCQVKYEAANIKTEGVLMCCLVRAIARLRGRSWVSMQQLWNDD
jgi:hypothetical protein